MMGNKWCPGAVSVLPSLSNRLAFGAGKHLPIEPTHEFFTSPSPTEALHRLASCFFLACLQAAEPLANRMQRGLASNPTPAGPREGLSEGSASQQT